MDKYYHLSEDWDVVELTPSIPRFAKPGHEDTTIKRVCFSNSIDNALNSIGAYNGRRLFVYVPEEEFEVVLPTVEQVPDAQACGEVWSLNPVKVKYIGMIMTTDEYGFNGYRPKPNSFIWVEDNKIIEARKRNNY